jgi:hypothetical protein
MGKPLRAAFWMCSMENEIWKPTIGYEGLYEVSGQGRIRSLPRRVVNKNGRIVNFNGRLLKTNWIHNYAYVHFSVKGRSHSVRVNRCVLKAFAGPPPSDRHHGAHIDGDRRNNAISNLYWATPKQNIEDCRRHGTMQVGEKSHRSKLTEKDVLEIRIRIGTWRGILRRETWKHI